MMALRIAHIRRKLGVSRAVAQCIANLAYGEGKQ
ncbi:hypothetical protein SAMN06295998_11812 [Primorskyibacter flagellatus]|uniref:Uncharacterized protein n=1 Tax=Primorskyibacter flagellatus TaxID=1387277 RepID=A0A1W2DTT2_9RHOB|nr:hypothetical protein SAMN06295998_11812 [Primorskyibacter flagellatus]